MTTQVALQELFQFKGYTVRRGTTSDRERAVGVLRACWEEYGLQFEPERATKDYEWAEDCFVRNEKGEFWVVLDAHSKLVGTAGYYEVSSAKKAVEIKKIYLLPEARGKKLGRALLEVGDSVKDGIGNVPTTPPALCHCEGPIEDAVLFVKKTANFSSKQLPLVLALESRIMERGYHTIYVETVTVFVEACKLYESAGYFQVGGVQHEVADQRLCKMIVQNLNTE